jgi:hypothetical protein
VNYQPSPQSAQQEQNEVLETAFFAKELGLPQPSMTEPDSSSTQTEQSPSTTTPMQEQQSESSEVGNSQQQENLMSTLQPALNQIRDMATQLSQSGLTPQNLASMMNSPTGESTTD